jgi:hypothetical protein
MRQEFGHAQHEVTAIHWGDREQEEIMDLQKTSVVTEPSGGLLVEIAIGDMLDTGTAREGIRFVVALPRLGENPSLSEIQIAAINRARALLEACSQSLRPKA